MITLSENSEADHMEIMCVCVCVLFVYMYCVCMYNVMYCMSMCVVPVCSVSLLCVYIDVRVEIFF